MVIRLTNFVWAIILRREEMILLGTSFKTLRNQIQSSLEVCVPKQKARMAQFGKKAEKKLKNGIYENNLRKYGIGERAKVLAKNRHDNREEILGNNCSATKPENDSASKAKFPSGKCDSTKLEYSFKVKYLFIGY